MNDELQMIQIAKAIEGARRPAVLWSGGKDSTALLHMARRVRPGIECILWRVPWLPAKWEFHNRLAEAWGLAVFDFPPVWAALCHGNGRIDIMEGYTIGAEALVVARGTEDLDEDRPWVCGLDWLTRPKAAGVDFPWDVLLHGHKSVDEDPCSGPVPLAVDVLRPAGCAEIHYPLRHMSDADVTGYLLNHGIPWDEGRYEVEEGEVGSGQLAVGSGARVLRTRGDKSLNSDYYNTCLRCIDKREGAFVRCPKNQLSVDNISGRVAEYYPQHAYCSLRSQNGGGAR